MIVLLSPYSRTMKGLGTKWVEMKEFSSALPATILWSSEVLSRSFRRDHGDQQQQSSTQRFAF